MPETGEWLIELATGKMYIVHIKYVDVDMIHVDECVWIADTGVRLNEFLSKGPQAASELESMTPGLFPRALLAGLWRWPHGIPVSQ